MKLVVAILLSVVCLNSEAQKDQSFISKWQDKTANNAAPEASDYVSAKKGAVLYCLSNDGTNLYVDIKITESIEENKVLQMGLVLWVNTDGKSRKITGIRYPIGAASSRPPRGAPANALLSQETPLSKAKTIELIGFKDVVPNRFPSNNTDNFRGYVKYDNDGNLLYSMTLPLSKLPEAVKGKNGKTLPMNIAIEYGAEPEARPQGPPSGGAPGGGSRSGGGGRSGGGSRGGGSGGGSMGPGMSPGQQTGQSVPKPVLIWIKNIVLAEKK